MNKEYTIYLAVVAVVLAAFAGWVFGLTFADVGAFTSRIFEVLTVIVSNDTLNFFVFAITFTCATMCYSFYTFSYLFAGKKGMNEYAGLFGLVSFTIIAFILMAQGTQAQVQQEPQQMAAWHTNMEVFGIFMVFVGLATLGRWIFLPRQKPQEDNTADDPDFH